MLINTRYLDTQLSIKIGDYVSDNGDGELFTQNQRLKYIERAYNKTIRLLSLAMERYAPDFAKRFYTKTFEENEINQGEISFTEGYSIIEQVIATITVDNGKSEVVIVMKSDNNTFLTTNMGLNAQKRPSVANKNIYYSIVNDKIVLLPTTATYNNCTILYRKDGEKIESVNQELPFDISYTDLVLSFASAEAMVDLGRGDKANAFFDDAYSQIKLLQQIALLKKREAGNS